MTNSRWAYPVTIVLALAACVTEPVSTAPGPTAALRLQCTSVAPVKAVEACTAYLDAIDTGSIDVSPPMHATAYRQRGDGWRMRFDNAKALPDFDRAIALDPDHVGGYVIRGYIKARLGDFTGAFADFDRAKALGDGSDDLVRQRAMAWIQAGRADRAIEELRSIAGPGPNDPRTARYLGYALYLHGNLSDAQVTMIVAEKDAGTAPDRAFARITRVLALLGQKRQEEAQNLAREPVDQLGNRWPAPILRHLAGDLDRETLLAIAQNAQNPQDWRNGAPCEAWYYLGEAALHRGDLAAARQAWQAAVTTNITTYVEHRFAAFRLR